MGQGFASTLSFLIRRRTDLSSCVMDSSNLGHIHHLLSAVTRYKNRTVSCQSHVAQPAVSVISSLHISEVMHSTRRNALDRLSADFSSITLCCSYRSADNV